MDFPRSRELSCSTRKAAFTPGIAAKLFIGNISQPRSTECQSIEQMGVEKGGPRVRILLSPAASHSRTHNAENGFCVLRVKARGHRELITVIGHAAVIAAGEWVTASGEWVNDRTHGQQFKSRFMRTSAPTSIEGIE